MTRATAANGDHYPPHNTTPDKTRPLLSQISHPHPLHSLTPRQHPPPSSHPPPFCPRAPLVTPRVASEPRRQRGALRRPCHAIHFQPHPPSPRPQRSLHSRRCVPRRLRGEASHAIDSRQARPKPTLRRPPTTHRTKPRLTHPLTSDRSRSPPISPPLASDPSHRRPLTSAPTPSPATQPDRRPSRCPLRADPGDFGCHRPPSPTPRANPPRRSPRRAAPRRLDARGGRAGRR